MTRTADSGRRGIGASPVTLGGGLNSRVSNWPTAVSTRWKRSRATSAVSRWIGARERRRIHGADSRQRPLGRLRGRSVAADGPPRRQKFFYVATALGDRSGLKLIERVPERVVAAVLCQPVGHRPENPRRHVQLRA